MHWIHGYTLSLANQKHTRKREQSDDRKRVVDGESATRTESEAERNPSSPFGVARADHHLDSSPHETRDLDQDTKEAPIK